jgi:Asp-tRNA(Asn)/Glu-tRNA(Gln) amidotransferase A subunit family amidase
MALHDLSLTAVLAGLDAGDFTSEELARALLARAGRWADLNAFIALDGDAVLSAAQASDARRRGGEKAPLLGAPLAIKDNIEVAGMATTAGTNALRGNIAARNAPVLDPLLAAGAIVFGKANMHELAFGCTSANAAFGEVGNPYDPDRVAGGSSGGTAAAVGARLAPAGLGSDTGGSVRIPAAFCGIVGFRPTTGRYPQAGIVPLSETRDTAGPMARRVEDVRLLDGVVTGLGAAPRPALADVRIGVPRGYFFESLDPAIATGVEVMLQRLRDYGITLVEADVPDLESVHKAGNFPVILYEAVRDLKAYLAGSGAGVDLDAIVDEIASPDVRDIVVPLMGEGAIAEDAYRQAIEVHRPHLQRLYAAYFDEHRLDAMVYPTTPVLPVPIAQEQSGTLEGGNVVPAITLFDRNVSPSSNAGIPSLTMPAGVSPDGLPLSVTLDARQGADAALLALACAIEEREPAMPSPPEA